MDYSSLHLEPNEHVILEVRRHWIVFAAQAFGLFLLAVIPFIVWLLLKIFTFNFAAEAIQSISFNLSATFLFFYILWFLALWLFFFVEWTKYYLDVWYVTEKRIIAVEQRFIFSRQISNLRFDRIQDVSIDMHGFLATLLQFGTVKVQTASEDNFDFILRTVRHPDEVRRVIFSHLNTAESVLKKNQP